MSSETKPPKKLLPFWPHYALSEFIAWYIMLGVLVTLAALFPAGLEDKANPLLTPEHVKPEWYFLSVSVHHRFNFRRVNVRDHAIDGFDCARQEPCQTL